MNKFKNTDNKSSLFEIAGNEFYFDLEALSQFVRLDNSESIEDILGEAKKEIESEKNNEVDEVVDYSQIVDLTKWETTKALMDVILNENSIVDEAMGSTKLGEQLSIPFRLSFNTLLKHNIIKENNGR
jgi:hypothetical protein